MRVVISPFFQDLIKYETTISPFHFVSLYIWLSAIFPGILKRWKTENQGLHKSMFIETLCWRLKRFLFVENNTFNIEWALLSDKQNVQKYFDKIRREINYGVKFQESLKKQIQWTSVFTNNSFIETWCSLFELLEMSKSALHLTLYQI